MIGKVLVMLMASVGVAAAQSPGASGDLLPRAPEARADEVNPGTAVLLSLGGTVASYTLMVVGAEHDSGGTTAIGALGTLIMPSVGRWYAHSSGFGGLAIRGAGAALGVAGFSMALDSCGFFSDGDCERSGLNLGAALVILGGVAYLGGTIYDIVEVPQEAHEHNARLHDVMLVPVVQHHGGGVALAARF